MLGPLRALAVGVGPDLAELHAGLVAIRQSGGEEKGKRRNSDPIESPSRNLEAQTFSTSRRFTTWQGKGGIMPLLRQLFYLAMYI